MAHLHCDQVRPYLQDYQSGAVAPFRRAWIAQHLAGCTACAEALVRLGSAAEGAAPEPEAEDGTAAAPFSMPVRRAVPKWYPWAVGLCTVGLALALAVLWPSGMGERDAPAGSAAHGIVEEVLSQQVRVQNDEIAWTLESLLIMGQTASLTYSVDGPRGAYMLNGPVQADQAGAVLPVWGERITQRPRGLDGSVNFPVGDRPTGIRVSLPGILHGRGEKAIVPLTQPEPAEHQHGLWFQVLDAGESQGGYVVRVAVEGEEAWMVVPELGVTLAGTGYAEGALSWEREQSGSVLRFSFPVPPPGVSPLTVHLPLAEQVRGPWQAWVLIP